MKNENIRFYIKVRSKLGISIKDVTNELKSALEESAPSFSTVSRWFKHFEGGYERLNDKNRSGRPITKVTKPNIEVVRALIEEDRHSSYDDIVAETSLCRQTIFTIIHSHLLMKKITARWVPYELSEKNIQDRVRICQDNLAKLKENKWRLCDIITGDESWFYHRQVGRKQDNAAWLYPNEKPKTVARQGNFEPKTMFIIFFKSTGIVSITYLDRGKTIDNKSYMDECLKPCIAEIIKQRPICGTKNMKFHHDNARPHIHQSIKKYLIAQNFIIMEHPPYSPDLAPCDFWLFDYIKRRLTNHTSSQSLAAEITRIAASIPVQEYQKTFTKWVERMELCIKHKGHYFEHLFK